MQEKHAVTKAVPGAAEASPGVPVSNLPIPASAAPPGTPAADAPGFLGRRFWRPVLYQVPEASRALLWGNWHAIRDQHLASNALVTVEGGPAPAHDRSLLVNRFYRVLGRRAWLVLCVLASHHVARGGGRTPFAVPISKFISADEIVERIASCLLSEMRKEFGETEFWPWPAPDDVHNEILDLRNSLEKGGVNPNVIERTRQGFRFSVPPPNLLLVCWQRCDPPFLTGPGNGNGNGNGGGNGNGNGNGHG